MSMDGKKLISAGKPDPDDHYGNILAELIEGMSSRETPLYAKVVITLMSIVNIGDDEPEAWLMVRQMADILNELDPIQFNTDKIRTDLKMLFKYQNTETLRRKNGPSTT